MVSLSSGISHSSLMNRDFPYRILLPDGHGRTQDKFPVLYLLHGLFGDFTNWTDLTGLTRYAEDHNLIIVMPEGEDGWYVDSAVDGQRRFESYLISEFIPEIEDLFQITKRRGSRAIAGLSMGGYGALKLALKFPELFVFAGSVSGAFSAPRQSDERPGFDWENLKPSILQAFGAENSSVRRENDLFELIPQRAKSPNLPEIYLDCGDRDGFLPVNRELHQLLREKNVPHEFFVGTGGHDWNYWDRRINEILKRVGRAVS